MKHPFLTLLAVTAIGFGSLTIHPAFAQDKKGKTPAPAGTMSPTKKDNRASNVFVCKACKTYYSAVFANKMKYKDPMGHKLAHMDKAPVGYKDGSKMKMEPMKGNM